MKNKCQCKNEGEKIEFWREKSKVFQNSTKIIEQNFENFGGSLIEQKKLSKVCEGITITLASHATRLALASRAVRLAPASHVVRPDLASLATRLGNLAIYKFLTRF